MSYKYHNLEIINKNYVIKFKEDNFSLYFIKRKWFVLNH